MCLLTVNDLESLPGSEPHLVRANAYDRAVLLMEGLAQMEHAAVAHMISVPGRGDGSETRTRYA